MAEVKEKVVFRDSNADRLKGRDYFFGMRRGESEAEREIATGCDSGALINRL